MAPQPRTPPAGPPRASCFPVAGRVRRQPVCCPQQHPLTSDHADTASHCQIPMSRRRGVGLAMPTPRQHLRGSGGAPGHAAPAPSSSSAAAHGHLPSPPCPPSRPAVASSLVAVHAETRWHPTCREAPPLSNFQQEIHHARHRSPPRAAIDSPYVRQSWTTTGAIVNCYARLLRARDGQGRGDLPAQLGGGHGATSLFPLSLCDGENNGGYEKISSYS
jgi:hypothetical protein